MKLLPCPFCGSRKLTYVRMRCHSMWGPYPQGRPISPEGTITPGKPRVSKISGIEYPLDRIRSTWISCPECCVRGPVTNFEDTDGYGKRNMFLPPYFLDGRSNVYEDQVAFEIAAGRWNERNVK